MRKISNIFRCVLLFCSALCFYNLNLQSQNYGIFFGLEYLRKEGDFRQFKSIPDSIPYIGSGIAITGNIGAYYNFKISRNIYLQSQVGIGFLPLRIDAERDFSMLFDTGRVSNEFLLNKKLSLELNQIIPFLSFCLNYTPIKHLSFNAGLTSAFHLSSPSQISYFDKKYFRDSIPRFKVDTGYLPSGGKNKHPVSLTFVVGVNYEIPFSLANSFKLGLSPYFSFGFSNLTSEFTSDLVAFGFRLNISPTKLTSKITPAKPPLPNIIDTLPAQNNQSPLVEEKTHPSLPQFNYNLDLINIYKGKYHFFHSVFWIKKNIENHVPLLNYVFFDYGSSKLAERYIRLDNSGDFNPDSLNYKNPLDVYWNILNIIGYRLQQNPEAKIRLIGCNSNIGEEYDNLRLSKMRAEIISNYLAEVWNISPKRISIEARNLPQNPSNPNIPEGNQENQRVEIHSDSPDILSPVTIIETNYIFVPDTIRFKITMNSETKGYKVKFLDSVFYGFNLNPSIKVDSFDVSLSKFFQNRSLEKIDSLGELYGEISGLKNTKFKYIPISVELYHKSGFIEEMISTFIALSEPKDKKMLFISGNDSTLLEIPELPQKSNEKFSLILFDFNSSKITPHQKDFLTKISPKIAEARNIKLIGHTDIIGERNYNFELSKARAEEVARVLNLNSAHVLGVGSQQIRFDNELPEGRFYSRTVEIVVEY